MNEKRNIKKEKKILCNLQLMGWIWSLGAVTITVYLFADIFVDIESEMNYYMYGMLAGWTGAIWAVGMNQAVSFWKRQKSERKWLNKESYKKNLHNWIIISIVSLAYIFIFSLLISFVNS